MPCGVDFTEAHLCHQLLAKIQSWDVEEGSLPVQDGAGLKSS